MEWAVCRIAQIAAYPGARIRSSVLPYCRSFVGLHAPRNPLRVLSSLIQPSPFCFPKEESCHVPPAHPL
jgi:hypothetical protein